MPMQTPRTIIPWHRECQHHVFISFLVNFSFQTAFHDYFVTLAYAATCITLNLSAHSEYSPNIVESKIETWQWMNELLIVADGINKYLSMEIRRSFEPDGATP